MTATDSWNDSKSKQVIKENSQVFNKEVSTSGIEAEDVAKEKVKPKRKYVRKSVDADSSNKVKYDLFTEDGDRIIKLNIRGYKHEIPPPIKVRRDVWQKRAGKNGESEGNTIGTSKRKNKRNNPIKSDTQEKEEKPQVNSEYIEEEKHFKTNYEATRKKEYEVHEGNTDELNRQKAGLKSFPEIIVKREEWGALPPQGECEPLQHPVANVIFAYKTGVEQCEEEEDCRRLVRQLQEQHMAAGMPDIAFNFLIGGDYRVYEGRGWHLQPEGDVHFPELRGRRLDVGFLGDFEASKTDGMCWSYPGMGIDLAHYGVGQQYLEKRYRLLETEKFVTLDDYEPGKEKEFPELEFRIEDWYPSNPLIEDWDKYMWWEDNDVNYFRYDAPTEDDCTDDECDPDYRHLW